MTLVFCLCSVLSKEQGITIVAVCVTYEFFILYKVNGFTRPHHLQSEKGYQGFFQLFYYLLCAFILLIYIYR